MCYYILSLLSFLVSCIIYSTPSFEQILVTTIAMTNKHHAYIRSSKQQQPQQQNHKTTNHKTISTTIINLTVSLFVTLVLWLIINLFPGISGFPACSIALPRHVGLGPAVRNGRQQSTGPGSFPSTAGLATTGRGRCTTSQGPLEDG